jgi:hypothetical protein
MAMLNNQMVLSSNNLPIYSNIYEYILAYAVIPALGAIYYAMAKYPIITPTAPQVVCTKKCKNKF